MYSCLLLRLYHGVAVQLDSEEQVSAVLRSNSPYPRSFPLIFSQYMELLWYVSSISPEKYTVERTSANITRVRCAQTSYQFK